MWWFITPEDHKNINLWKFSVRQTRKHYETPTSGFLSQIRRSAWRTQLRPTSFKLKRSETHFKRTTRRHKNVLKNEHRPGEMNKPDDCCARWRHSWPTPRPQDRWQLRTPPSCLPTWWPTPNLAWKKTNVTNAKTRLAEISEELGIGLVT